MSETPQQSQKSEHPKWDKSPEGTYNQVLRIADMLGKRVRRLPNDAAKTERGVRKIYSTQKEATEESLGYNQIVIRDEGKRPEQGSETPFRVVAIRDGHLLIEKTKYTHAPDGSVSGEDAVAINLGKSGGRVDHRVMSTGDHPDGRPTFEDLPSTYDPETIRTGSARILNQMRGHVAKAEIHNANPEEAVKDSIMSVIDHIE